jgi:hypothetical protein
MQFPHLIFFSCVKGSKREPKRVRLRLFFEFFFIILTLIPASGNELC